MQFASDVDCCMLYAASFCQSIFAAECLPLLHFYVESPYAALMLSITSCSHPVSNPDFCDPTMRLYALQRGCD